ncbi:hypothetical protein [Streptomyces sp. NPDC050982]|uniref:hypothetical protein n=1 Tax=Streptomyces sp. NPDC050982 TaxID=3154746 RepID=UPI0033FA1D66
MDAYCGEHEEHRAETGRDPIVIAHGEIRDAYAENGPDRDEEGFADPERQETEEETEHPVISPGQDHIRRGGSHNSGYVRALPIKKRQVDDPEIAFGTSAGAGTCGQALALDVHLDLSALIVFAFFQRWFVQGVSSSAVKD